MDGHFGQKKKGAIFDNTPAEKWTGPRIAVSGNFLKNLISIIWDSFYGGENPSCDFFSSGGAVVYCIHSTLILKAGVQTPLAIAYTFVLQQDNLLLLLIQVYKLLNGEPIGCERYVEYVFACNAMKWGKKYSLGVVIVHCKCSIEIVSNDQGNNNILHLDYPR